MHLVDDPSSALDHGNSVVLDTEFEVAGCAYLPRVDGIVNNDKRSDAGVPIDLRSATKRLSAAASTHGDVEFDAARVVARCLGQTVEIIDDGSRDALVDILITYDIGATG